MTHRTLSNAGVGSDVELIDITLATKMIKIHVFGNRLAASLWRALWPQRSPEARG